MDCYMTGFSYFRYMLASVFISYSVFLIIFFAAKNGVCRGLIGFKEYTEKKDKIALDISQLKKEISDTKVKSRLELEKLRVQQQLAKDISRAKASNV